MNNSELIIENKGEKNAILYHVSVFTKQFIILI